MREKQNNIGSCVRQIILKRNRYQQVVGDSSGDPYRKATFPMYWLASNSRVCIYVCFMYLCVCVCVCARVCVYVHVRACMYVCVGACGRAGVRVRY